MLRLMKQLVKDICPACRGLVRDDEDCKTCNNIGTIEYDIDVPVECS